MLSKRLFMLYLVGLATIAGFSLITCAMSGNCYEKSYSITPTTVTGDTITLQQAQNSPAQMQQLAIDSCENKLSNAYGGYVRECQEKCEAKVDNCVNKICLAKGISADTPCILSCTATQCTASATNGFHCKCSPKQCPTGGGN